MSSNVKQYRKNFNEGDYVLKEGEVGNHLILLEKGIYDIYIKGKWENNVSADAFNESSGSVISYGTDDQTCEDEEFNILVLDKPSGDLFIPSWSNVSCRFYDWNEGTLRVEGQFTAIDLSDNGILGTYILDGGQRRFVSHFAMKQDALDVDSPLVGHDEIIVPPVKVDEEGQQ